MVRNHEITTVTIANTGSNSTKVDTRNFAWGTVQLDDSMDASQITFEYSIDGTNWTSVPTEGSEANPTTSVSATYTYTIPVKAYTAPYIRFVSDAAETAERTLTVFQRD